MPTEAAISDDLKRIKVRVEEFGATLWQTCLPSGRNTMRTNAFTSARVRRATSLGVMAFGLSIQIASAQREDFYIYSQGNLQPVKSGNPNEVKPEYWTVWVFYDRNEGQASKGARCGAHDGQTAAQAMQAAKQFLQFNISWAKFIYGPAWQANLDNCSGKNIQGPIAVMGEEVPWRPASIPPALREAYEQIKAARETWQQLKEILDISNPRVGPKEHNPYEHVGSVLREYSKTLQQATLLFNQLASKVLNGASLRGLGDTVQLLNGSLQELKEASQFAKSEVPMSPTVQANTNQTPSAGAWSFHTPVSTTTTTFSGGMLTQRMIDHDSGDSDITLQVPIALLREASIDLATPLAEIDISFSGSMPISKKGVVHPRNALDPSEFLDAHTIDETTDWMHIFFNSRAEAQAALATLNRLAGKTQ